MAKLAEETVQRRCRIETMEPRRMLNADPLFVGSVYIEDDLGTDATGDQFYVAFEGGADTTRLNRLVFDGKQSSNANGLSEPDVYFDILPDGSPGNVRGFGGAHPFEFSDNSVGITADQVSFSVVDGGTRLVVDVEDFVQGDVLAFTIDVDQFFTNKLDDQVTAGQEWGGSQFEAEFSDQHYDIGIVTSPVDQTFDYFFSFGSDDVNDTGLLSDLPTKENKLTENGLSTMENRTAGALHEFELTPKPITIAGTVYHDRNLDLVQNGSDAPIRDVTLSLQKLDTNTGRYEDVVDEFGSLITEQTDLNGDYKFDVEHKLTPGTYRVIEQQPSDFPYSVGAIPGTVEGQATGFSQLGDLDGDNLSDSGNVLSEIVIPLGDMHAVDYDFAEALPAQISGYVYHDRDNDGNRDPGEEGIGGVDVEVVASSINVYLRDEFGPLPSVIVTTDENGYYSVDGLPPGEYDVYELAFQSPVLDDYLDGKDSAGRVDGSPVGEASDPDADILFNVTLLSESEGVEYNFGEIKLGSLQGHVFLSTPDGDCVGPLDPEYRPFAGLTVRLTDQNGAQWTVPTDDFGQYSFDSLPPGTYGVELLDPGNGFSETYAFGASHVGTIEGISVGAEYSPRFLTQITLDPGDNGINYDFCLTEKSMISGYVYHDRDDDGLREGGEEGLKEISVSLYKLSSDQQTYELVATRQTDSNGFYKFTDLTVGQYYVKEGPVTGYLDGKDTAGTIDGVPTGVADTLADEITQIALLNGQNGVEYNFGEFLPGTIEGIVHTDVNSNCVYEASDNEELIPNVYISLWREVNNGGGTSLEFVDDVYTDSSGHYQFTDLSPGVYVVQQDEIDGYFEGGQVVGHIDGSTLAGTGDAGLLNEISSITMVSGLHLVEYNFCEIPPSSISGFVFQDGAPIFKTDDVGPTPAELAALRDGIKTADDTPIPGVILELRNGITGEPIMVQDALPGFYNGNPTDPIRMATDGNGYYEFRGLPAGNYAVFEIHPQDFIDHIDTPGTTQGIAVNAIGFTSTFALQTLSPQVLTNNDAILRIAVGVGETSEQNNFSEVKLRDKPPIIPPPNPPETPPLTPVLNPGTLPPPAPIPVAGALPVSRTSLPIYGAGGPGYTWHLSIINAGQPRGEGLGLNARLVSVDLPPESDNIVWNQFQVDVGNWQFGEDDQESEASRYDSEKVMLGIEGGRPVVGDFNGDGIDEVALFRDGHWFIDVNGNGVWDSEDIWAKLGTAVDQAVAGDWDGDGKDDIGIFGPIWPRDPIAIEAEPGLPDPDNVRTGRPKNLPPTDDEATSGYRVMKNGVDAKRRFDVIDHVFDFGVASDVAIAGDWNGDGIRNIGIFRGGTWRLDLDGDGKWTEKDAEFEFGAASDLPVVGDFDGDGIEEIGIYRAGTWILDINGNRELDAHDKVFEMGTADDLPIAGDFNGDGVDQPALYRTIHPAHGDGAGL